MNYRNFADEHVQIRSLWGLWVILAVAIGLATIAGLVDYELKRRRGGADREVVEIQERATVFRRALTKSVSFAPRNGGGSLRGPLSNLGTESNRCSLDDNDEIFTSGGGTGGGLRNVDVTPMTSMYDGIVPVQCLEVVTESHEESSPKTGMLKQSVDSSRSSRGSQGFKGGDIRNASDSGIVSSRRRSQARTEAAAASAAAAIAAEEAEEAAASAAAAESSRFMSSRHRSQARTEAAAAAAAAAVAAEEASSACAAASAQSVSNHDRGSPVATSQDVFDAHEGNPSPSMDSSPVDPPVVAIHGRLPPPLPLRNLYSQHKATGNQHQRSFGRTSSSVSSTGRTARTPRPDDDSDSSLFTNNYQQVASALNSCSDRHTLLSFLFPNSVSTRDTSELEFIWKFG